MADNSYPSSSQDNAEPPSKRRQKASTEATGWNTSKPRAKSSRKTKNSSRENPDTQQSWDQDSSRSRPTIPVAMDTIPSGGSIFEPLSAHCNSAPGAWSPPRETVQSDPDRAASELVVQGSASQCMVGPSATFTPTAAGLRPTEAQPLGAEQVQAMINQALMQFRATSVPHCIPRASASQPPPRPDSPDLIEDVSSESGSDDYDSSRLILSDDEVTPASDPVPPTGLFNHSLFNSLLLKACTTANLTPEQRAAAPSTSRGPNAIYAEPVVTQNHVPCPPFFLNAVQKQWDNLGSLPSPGSIEKNMFNVAPALASLLEVPQVDEPLMSLFPNINIPGDIPEALKAEDKRVESALRRSHQATAWAIKASTSMAFFARASVLWLRELQGLVPPDQLRVHQNLGKLVATSQYLADASLNSARYSARAIAADVSARRLLWLKNWRADLKAKWRLATKPYAGGHLFGAALEPYLIEGKDKRKSLVNTNKKGDKRTGTGSNQGFHRRQSFRSTPSWDWPQSNRSFYQGSE